MSHYGIRKLSDRIAPAGVVQEVLDIVGKRVKVQGHYYGVVLRHNDSPYGAFPGNVYPVIVRLDSDFHGHINKEHAFKLSDIVIEEG